MREDITCRYKISLKCLFLSIFRSGFVQVRLFSSSHFPILMVVITLKNTNIRFRTFMCTPKTENLNNIEPTQISAITFIEINGNGMVLNTESSTSIPCIISILQIFQWANFFESIFREIGEEL